MLDDVEKRKFIQVGLAAWLILLTAGGDEYPGIGARDGWMGLAGGAPADLRRGRAGVIHYWWLVKKGVRTPWKVTLVFVVLMLWRVGLSIQKRARAKMREREVWSQDQAVR